MEVDSKQKFIMQKWNGVTMWKWQGEIDQCQICRQQLMEACIDCIAMQEENKGECTVAWGKCNHAFHFHCINRWTKKQPTCPLDNKQWETEKYGK